jgi:hypothetical protein
MNFSAKNSARSVLIAAIALLGTTTVRAQAAPARRPDAGSINFPGNPQALPVQAEVRFQVNDGDSVSVAALGSDAKARPLLESTFRSNGGNNATVTAFASGQPMATVPIADRTWSRREVKSGTATYAWLFPKVKNTWNERDRREIGAAYDTLMPFAARSFTLRLLLTPETRQIWIDDRLVAEEKVAGPQSATFTLKWTGALAPTYTLSQPVETISGVATGANATAGRFLPLSLANYSHRKDYPGQRAAPPVMATSAGRQVPLLPVPGGLDLGESLYRYRLSAGGDGPYVGYLNANEAWPGPLQIDPATFTFRVPYRNYQNAWLVVSKEDTAATVPRGTFRFYRENTGVPASTDFEVTPAAIKSGLVTALPKRPGAMQLYLVRVPIDTDGFQGFRDMSDQFIDFEVSKPVQLTRSYPDPIYYGPHPAGLPSSLRVVGITLEEAPFDFQVRPAQYGHVFAEPEKVEYAVRVTNTGARPLTAKIAVATRSYDSEEKKQFDATATVPAGTTVDVPMSLALQKYGWHELKTTVEAAGATRRSTLSLVRLPRDTRTYGTASNETRIGAWILWGHYTPFSTDRAANEPILAMMRKIGIRNLGGHGAFIDPLLAKKYDFVAGGPHTDVGVYHRLNENDPVAMEKMVAAELAQVEAVLKYYPDVSYFYGGEWGISKEVYYSPEPRYTDQGPRELTEVETNRVTRQSKIFKAIGEAMRKKYPTVRLVLQWGGPQGTIPFLRMGFPQNLVDQFGMDQPSFELMPELSNMPGSMTNLWTLRQEAKRLGWPRLPINWTEGPFLPTNPGALTEEQQANYQVRNWLVGMSYGIDQFEAGVVPHDAGNYYGSEHYGAGVFHRIPLENPKPAVAALATAATMTNGADPVGGVETGNLSTYCLAFKNAKTNEKLYALWRVRGTSELQLKVTGRDNVSVTDAMGNARRLTVKDGAVSLTLSASPVWLTGAGEVSSIRLAVPVYTEKPGAVVKPLAAFSAEGWRYDGGEDAHYANNHFANRRITDANLKASFVAGEASRPKMAAEIALPVEPGDKPLANRYGALVPKQALPIPGKAQALGLWIKGNASWGRIAYQLRDAKGEVWTSTGTRDDWNCDDAHAWSFINFEGWRYVRFPLPGNAPYDAARELETTWWGSRGGDGIVDLPLSVEKIFVEARNEVPYLGEMKLVPERSFKLSDLMAEYADAADATASGLKQYQLRKPMPEWNGPQENPIARLQTQGAGAAPAIRGFEEPGHFNDGRRMTIRFDGQEGLKYNLYLSLYPDGRGAELLKAGVLDNTLVVGLRPEVPLYLFLTSVGTDGRESKPSEAFKLVTHDNFAEK